MGIQFSFVEVLPSQRGAGRLEQSRGVAARPRQVFQNLGRRVLVPGEHDLEGGGVLGRLLGLVEVPLDEVRARLADQEPRLGAVDRGGRGGRRGRRGRRRRGASGAGQVQPRTALAERLTVGRGQVLFVGRHVLEHVDGVGLALFLEGVLGEPQLLRGGASAFERRGVVLHQAGEFLLFGLREGGLAGGRLLQEGRGAVVIAVALGLDGVAKGPGGLGAEELGDARRVVRRRGRGRRRAGEEADDEDESGSCFCPSHHGLL